MDRTGISQQLFRKQFLLSLDMDRIGLTHQLFQPKVQQRTVLTQPRNE